MKEYHSLQKVYNELLPLMGSNPEPFETVCQVEEHRHFWRPKQPRVILLAESHVYTALQELREMRGFYVPGLDGVPRTYVRLVYCLGYGENEYAGWSVGNNPGTPQFWKIFYSCLHGPDNGFSPILKTRTPLFHHRIANKYEVLRNLQRRGIWLLDASMVALYRTGALRSDGDIVERVIRLSWQDYVSHVFSAAKPEFTILIGKGVERAIGQQIRDMVGNRYTCLPQPQARLSAEEHYLVLRKYNEICHEYAAA